MVHAGNYQHAGMQACMLSWQAFSSPDTAF